MPLAGTLPNALVFKKRAGEVREETVTWALSGDKRRFSRASYPSHPRSQASGEGSKGKTVTGVGHGTAACL